MEIHIRQEIPADHEAVSKLIEKAFEKEELSDQKEHFLVDRLRKSKDFVPELSLVALDGRDVVGHVLLSEIRIKNGEKSCLSLALAPVSVLPEYQGKGIGGRLIREAHEAALALGYKSVVLLGHAEYYPRFGYKTADSFGISMPFKVPKENCMALELVENGLKGVEGKIEYPEAFNV
ncbi:N-acetyltransferase [Fulvitalea axinellae]|uniref:N-acetyltransferase n=1 Tax=Fulvitalea axinellae TaxID=1182444 RepID=A0AAU9D1A4_9BACT|nr:N-acetyltransferase [Fulvitalea axinellae]